MSDYQETIDILHKAFSRLHSYVSQRISNRYKQPNKYLLREKARELRAFIEKMNRSFLVWRDSENPVTDWILSEYISDINALLIRFDKHSILRQFGSEIKEIFRALYDQMIKFISVGQSVQLEIFDSNQTFFEDESIKSKYVCQIFIDFEWVSVLKSVGLLLNRIKDGILSFPSSLLAKSLWKSAFSFRQLSFADI